MLCVWRHRCGRLLPRDGLANQIDVIVNLGLATTITSRYVEVLSKTFKPESEEFQHALRRLRVLHGLAQQVLNHYGAAIDKAASEPVNQEQTEA